MNKCYKEVVSRAREQWLSDAVLASVPGKDSLKKWSLSRVSHQIIWREGFPGRGKNKCKYLRQECWIQVSKEQQQTLGHLQGSGTLFPSPIFASLNSQMAFRYSIKQIISSSRLFWPLNLDQIHSSKYPWFSVPFLNRLKHHLAYVRGKLFN